MNEQRNISSLDFCIKPNYKSRETALYYHNTCNDPGLLHQPDLYSFAGYLARRYGCKYLIDIGCGQARKLVELYPEFEIVGIDYGENIQFCLQNFPFGHWIEADLETVNRIPLDPAIVRNSIVICADVIEHLITPSSLLELLQDLLIYSPVAILSTPERDLVHGVDDFGPPQNPYHVREWNLKELERFLSINQFNIMFSGLTSNNNRDKEKKTSIIILSNTQNIIRLITPPDFRVIALISTYNEEDIIAPVINHLINEGIEIYIIDNWSTDHTFEIAQSYFNNGVVGIERWPLSGPSMNFSWKELLRRKEELSLELDADWFIHHDADEIRESPWPGISLRDAIYRVDRDGYNAIDFTVLNFVPVDNNYQPGTNLENNFKYFEFGTLPSYFVQLKGWKKNTFRVNIHESGGHSAEFSDRKVYPYKFLLRHYPIRSQFHGEKKIFEERKPRYDPLLRAGGWHTQYDNNTLGSTLLKDPEGLVEFDSNFHSIYLIERLSGIGIVRYETENTIPSRITSPAELLVQRFRAFLTPQGSLRARAARKILAFLLFPFTIKRNMKISRDLALIRNSGFFDQEWYLDHNPDVAQSGMDPGRHYLLFGGFEGRDPGPKFSSKWYLFNYADVKNARVNPLVHYLRFGKDENRLPNVEFLEASKSVKQNLNYSYLNVPSCLTAPSTANDQLLYFTSSSLTADDNVLVFISDRSGSPNLYGRELRNGKEWQISFNSDGYLKSYVYFDGIDERGFGKASVSLHAPSGTIYFLQGRQIYQSNLHGKMRCLAEIPSGQVTAFTHVSQDGHFLCVPTTDRRALDGKFVNNSPLYNIDQRIQAEGLNSYLRVYDTLSGDHR
jgi:hypothetical protein